MNGSIAPWFIESRDCEEGSTNEVDGYRPNQYYAS